MTVARDGDSQGGLYGWYVVFVLVVAYVFSFLDRQILNLLVEPIKRDLGLSDVRVSLLQGFAFAIFLGIGSIPIGRLVDTARRMTIISVGVALWSLATASCGVASGFGGLFLCRMGVGIGEATLTPSASSVISDHLPPRRRGIGLGLYSVGVYVGAGLALVIGAEVIRHLPPSVMLPVFGPIHAWQAVFIVVGLPGLLVAAWTASLREPARRDGTDGAKVLHAGPPSLADTFAFFNVNRPVLLALTFCAAFASMTSYGTMAWAPSFFVRDFGWTATEAGWAYGLLNVVFGTAGVLTGGWLGDRLCAQGVRNGRLLLMAGAGLGAAVFALVAPFAPEAGYALALFGPATFFTTVIIGTGPAALQDIMPNQMRGVAIALAVLAVNLIGLGLGPTGIALVTDVVVHDEHKLFYGLAIVPAVAALLSAGCGFLCARNYAAACANFEAWQPSGRLTPIRAPASSLLRPWRSS